MRRSKTSSRPRAKVVETLWPVGGTDGKSGEGKAKLSSREREVLELLSQGMQDKLIADTLSLSPRTVRFHLGRIYKKLNVRTRVEAALKHSNANFRTV
jgi:DNA-binding NarL/FixJ family response regulator